MSMDMSMDGRYIMNCEMCYRREAQHQSVVGSCNPETWKWGQREAALCCQCYHNVQAVITPYKREPCRHGPHLGAGVRRGGAMKIVVGSYTETKTVEVLPAMEGITEITITNAQGFQLTADFTRTEALALAIAIQDTARRK